MERGGEGRELVVIEMKEKGRGRGVCIVKRMRVYLQASSSSATLLVALP